jgi:alkylation response protein AidB-like acyl-CoA dehydrogenase
MMAFSKGGMPGKHNMQHPKEILSKEIIKSLRKKALETETLQSLPPETLVTIYKQGWFHVWVPKAFGGLEYTLPDTVRLFEALAYADANVGWCVNLGAGANMFSGYLSPKIAADIFSDPVTCCAGSGAVSGKAQQTTGGYILNGRWKYASGANHATHFTANAYLLDEAGEQILEDGLPQFRSFIIPASKIRNYKNWNAIGLKATSSNDFGATDVFVPESDTFTLLKPSDFATGAVYQFPFDLLASINMTCMLTGIALHFEESYQELAAVKKPLHSDLLLADNPRAQFLFNNASRRFHDARTKMYAQLEAVWACYGKGETANAFAIDQFKSANSEATAAARNLINELYPLCGLNIVTPESELNKIWRDAAVAGQHYLLSPLVS